MVKGQQKWFWRRLILKNIPTSGYNDDMSLKGIMLTFKEEKKEAFERQGLMKIMGLKWDSQVVFRGTSNGNRNSFQFSGPQS